MFGLRKEFLIALIVIAACSAVVVASQQRTAVAPFTAAQANAGRDAYQTNCAGCHVADLGGRNEAPQLAGSNLNRIRVP